METHLQKSWYIITTILWIRVIGNQHKSSKNINEDEMKVFFRTEKVVPKMEITYPLINNNSVVRMNNYAALSGVHYT